MTFGDPLAETTTLPAWAAQVLQYKTYLALFAAAALATAIATPIYAVVARRLDWVDRPVGRKRHGRPTPTMGGLVIFTTVFAGALVALTHSNHVGEMLREHRRPILALLVCTTCMIALGVIDDRHRIRPKVKLLVQLVVAIAAVWLGYRIEKVTLPFAGSVDIPVLGRVLSVVWLVGITNAINLTDGLDGLAAGICFLASSVNAVVAVWLGNYYMAVMMVLLAGALLGFLRWNFHPARVFLGDAGSLGLGMYLAMCSLHSAQKAHTLVLILVPLFALGYPIFDTLFAVARRTVRGQPLFAADREHVHHRLLDRGASPSRAAVQIYVASIVLCAACLLAMTANHLALGLAVAGVLGMTLFSARVLGYLEWGGWLTRWRGRDETKVLHAAAHYARLKIRQARGDDAVVRALAVIASEIGAHGVVLTRNGVSRSWADPNHVGRDDRAVFRIGFEPADGVRVQFDLDRPDPLDAERTQLVEDLCREAADRLHECAGVSGDS